MSPEETLQRLSRLNPVPPQALHGLERSEASEALLERIVSREPATERPIPTSRRLRHSRKVQLVAAIAAVVALVAALIIIVPGPGSAPANAAQLLRQVAQVAAQAPGPAAGSVEYQQTEQRTAAVYSSPDGPYTVFLDSQAETWVEADGSGRRETNEEQGVLASARDRARWESAGSPEFGASSHADTFGPSGNPFRDLTGLSDDPEVLQQQLPHLIGRDSVPDDLLFKLAGEVLAQPDAPPSLRAALYRVLAGLPDVDVLGPTTDPSGRTGVGVSIDSGSSGQQTRQTLILDASSAQMLASELVLLQPSDTIGATPPVTLGYTVYRASGMVDSEQAVPSGGVG